MEKKKCLKCGHEWWPRVERRQLKCPACQCKKWDTYKKKDNKVEKTLTNGHN